MFMHDGGSLDERGFLFLKQNTCEAVQTGSRVICFAFLSNVVVVNVVVVVVVQK